MYKKIELDYTTLEPYIDNETLYLHYNKHYGNYLNKLNELLKKEKIETTSLLEIINNLDQINLNNRGEILFNLGGVLNHSLYFYNISDKKNNLPTQEIKKAIEEKYGNYNNFKEEFKKNALALKGSGYTFLVLDKDELKIINTSNQDTPYYYDYTPLIALDLWEHSYYLKYKNEKEKYIDAWFNLLDYEKINKLYLKLKTATTT